MDTSYMNKRKWVKFTGAGDELRIDTSQIKSITDISQNVEIVVASKLCQMWAFYLNRIDCETATVDFLRRLHEWFEYCFANKIFDYDDVYNRGLNDGTAYDFIERGRQLREFTRGDESHRVTFERQITAALTNILFEVAYSKSKCFIGKYFTEAYLLLVTYTLTLE